MGEITDRQHRLTYSAESIAEFAHLIHSPGRIHIDSDLARSLGYRDVLAHGVMLLNGLDSLMATAQTDNAWYVGRRIHCRFRRPVIAGDGIVTTLHDGEQRNSEEDRWKFTSVNDDGVTVIEGTVSDYP